MRDVRRGAAATALVLLTAAALVAAQSTPPAPNAAQVERGRYLVTIGGCNDCHTPWKMGPNGPEPDMTRMLSGHPREMEVPPPPDLGDGPWIGASLATNTAWAGPWGVSFTANLTPDDETGTGKWTEQEFMDTLRSGRHLGRGREILPPMPWPAYGQMTDEDLKSVYAYLRTIPKISNKVPDPLPPPAAH